MSDGTIISGIKQMRKYISQFGFKFSIFVGFFSQILVFHLIKI